MKDSTSILFYISVFNGIVTVHNVESSNTPQLLEVLSMIGDGNKTTVKDLDTCVDQFSDKSLVILCHKKSFDSKNFPYSARTIQGIVLHGGFLILGSTMDGTDLFPMLWGQAALALSELLFDDELKIVAPKGFPSIYHYSDFMYGNTGVHN